MAANAPLGTIGATRPVDETTPGITFLVERDAYDRLRQRGHHAAQLGTDHELDAALVEPHFRRELIYDSPARLQRCLRERDREILQRRGVPHARDPHRHELVLDPLALATFFEERSLIEVAQ